jgi:Ser/Thr protein kinase RdoA (MazF antagonist)
MNEFDFLTPQVVVAAIEGTFNISLDGTMSAYPSYVNRVYGLTDDDGVGYVAKFYRPNRWSDDAIIEEHQLVRECEEAEIPIVSPIADSDGETLNAVVAESDGDEQEYRFALYPKRGGRNFDAESEDDWLRLGRLVGRMHTIAAAGEARHRVVCTPEHSTAAFIEELRRENVVHPECREDFFAVTSEVLGELKGRFDGIPMHRLHGDCHRGNILDRVDEGLLLIDFDDMMMGPGVQDLWLLLPGRSEDSRRELALLAEGYEEFRTFDWTTLSLIEPLRIMRMIYYLAWCARQRQDARFLKTFPGWGTQAFWVKEIEDLRTQLDVIRGRL